MPLISSNGADFVTGTRGTAFAYAFPTLMLDRRGSVGRCGLMRQKSSLALVPFKVSDSYNYLKRINVRKNNPISRHCTAVSAVDLFCDEQSNEGEIDDLLSFKKVFEAEIDFIEIDVGVKGSLQMHYDNQTLSEVGLFRIESQPSAPDHQ